MRVVHLLNEPSEMLRQALQRRTLSQNRRAPALGRSGGLLMSAAFGSRALSNGTAENTSVSVPANSGPRLPVANEDTAYLANVEVTGVRVPEGGRSKIVSGEVKNRGQRSLTRVEITVYCLDRDGKAVFEKTDLPVLVTELSFSRDNTPLKAGYSRKFDVLLNDAPSDWSGKVDVKVTGVRLEADASK